MASGVPKVEWPNNARIAIVMQVTFEQFMKRPSPRTATSLVNVPLLPDDPKWASEPDLLFDSWQQYAEVGMWRLTDLLDRHGITATGVFSALSVERYPDAVKQFVSGGAVLREACAHAYSQDVSIPGLTTEAMRSEIKKCVDIFAGTLAVRPTGWISPDGQFKSDTPHVLAEQGFIYHGDYANSDAPFPVEAGRGRKIVGMSVPWDTNDTMHTRYGATLERYVDLFRRSFDVLYEEGGQMLGAVAHTAIYGRPFGIWAYDQVIRYAKRYPNVWFTTRQDIAQWYMRNYM